MEPIEMIAAPGDDAARTLSSGTAAAMLGISKSTLLRAVRRGWLSSNYHTPGGHLRFVREDLERFQGAMLVGGRAR